MTQPRGRHLTIGDIRLHVLEYPGSGPVLLLLPGITSTAMTWDFVSRRLAAFCKVFAIDLRGRGLSSTGADLGYGLDDYAGDIIGLIDQLGLRRPVILGHSMGARIALKIGAEAPQTTGPLILVDPPLSGPGRRDYPVPLQWYLDGLDAACRGKPTDTSNPLLKNWTPAQIADREQWLPTCHPAAIEGSWHSFHDEDIFRLMPAVQSKALLIYASEGGTVTDEEAQEIRRLIPDCQSVCIEGAGHMIPWDDLETFVDTAESFLSSLAPAHE